MRWLATALALADNRRLRKRVTVVLGLFGAAKAVASHRTPRLRVNFRRRAVVSAVPIFTPPGGVSYMEFFRSSSTLSSARSA